MLPGVAGDFPWVVTPRALNLPLRAACPALPCPGAAGAGLPPPLPCCCAAAPRAAAAVPGQSRDSLVSQGSCRIGAVLMTGVLPRVPAAARGAGLSLRRALLGRRGGGGGSR